MSEPEDQDKIWKTNHEPGSVEESYSRRMRFDKYLAMQALLMELAERGPDYPGLQHRAKEILAGMKMPRGPAIRAKERADELKALAFAYKVPGRVIEADGPIAIRAAALTVEALKAYERAHPPAPLDPLLLP